MAAKTRGLLCLYFDWLRKAFKKFDNISQGRRCFKNCVSPQRYKFEKLIETKAFISFLKSKTYKFHTFR